MLLLMHFWLSSIIRVGRILTNPPSHTTHRAAPQWAVLNLNADELAGFSWHPWHWFVKVGEPQKADQVVKGIEAAGGKALTVRADSAVAETVNTLGGLDILVNNAGVTVVAPIDQFSLEEFDQLVAINVRGVFVATQEAVRHMGEGGRIIMMGSASSDFTPVAGLSVYALAKGATPMGLPAIWGLAASRSTTFSLAQLTPT